MRRCAVDNCTNSDLTVLCHRFPKSRHSAQIWQQNLNLDHYPLELLMSKYSVCCMHFNSTDYRNSQSNSLNLNAIPQLEPTHPRKDSSKNNKTKEKEVQQDQHSPTQWPQMVDQQALVTSPGNVSDSIELLHEDTDEATDIDDNLICTPCDSDDICILPEEQNAADALLQSIDGTGFTMLDAASCVFMSESRNFEVSEHSADLKLCNESDSGHSNDFPPDSTDSDVEVLVSESIFESQWSETDCSAIVLKAGHTNNTDSAVSQYVSSKSDDISTKTNEVFDTDYEHLDKKQLIEIIKQQSTTIKELEQKLELFKLAQKTLIGHVKEFRQTICDEDSISN